MTKTMPVSYRGKYYLFFSMVLVVFLLCAPPFGTIAWGYSGPALIVDGADLLTEKEADELEKLAEEISDRHRCSVSTVFVKSLGNVRSIQELTDDFFDQNSYGYGNTEDGIMLLVSMAEREFHMSTCGAGIIAFTDAGLDVLEDEFVSRLSKGDYAGAAKRFLNACDRFLTQAETDAPFDIGTIMPAKEATPLQLGIALVGGFLLGGLPVMPQKKALKSVKAQTGASTYVQSNGIQLSAREDRFITVFTNKVPIPKNTGSRGGPHGGSVTHFSSGGHSHGGRSGKF